MARSWEERVRGASQKVSSSDEDEALEHDSAEVQEPAPRFDEHLAERHAAVAPLVSEQPSGTMPAGLAGLSRRAADRRHNKNAQKHSSQNQGTDASDGQPSSGGVPDALVPGALAADAPTPGSVNGDEPTASNSSDTQIAPSSPRDDTPVSEAMSPRALAARSRRARKAEAEAEAEAEAASAAAAAFEASSMLRTEPAMSPTAELVIEGLSLAVSATELPVAVVERESGRVRWSSDTWTERFGEKDLWSRHMASTTEFGESPLPSPGESWQRTRTLQFADGAEDLVDLLLLGSVTSQGIEFVTVVARDRARSGPLVSDRAEVTGVIDGALKETADGSVAVLYVDLDRFKVVHDLVGNIEALRLLDLVNRRIASTVRGSDLVFRLPSDEFVIVASELLEADAAEELAERVRVGVATLADVGHDMALTASVGVAFGEAGQTGEALLSAAETAVYLAKGRGRNRVAVHDEELRSRTQRLLVVERQLRRAIDRRDVRFAYQPVVRISTGEVVGAEALLRLGGDVGLSAVEVVAAAEHSGLMGALGTLVLQGVEEQLGALLADPSGDHSVMVNLSANQLADEGLLTTLGAMAANPNLADGRLAVEVPEMVVREHRPAFDRLVELTRPAFQIGIDGFGASFRSVEILRSLPVDYVKLHRSITTSIGADTDHRLQVADLISDATAQGISVVALGVERIDQAAALQAMGCELAQGFLYAGAVTADDLLELVANGFDTDYSVDSSI